MRPAPILIATVLVLAACGRAPLPFTGADAGPEPDAGTSPGDGGEAPSAPPLDLGIPIGQQPVATVAGATTVSAVVPVSDRGVIVAGGFTGTVSFAPDKTLVAGSTGSGFVARYRTDGQLVWVRAVSAPLVVVADMAPLGGDEVALAGWFEGDLTIAGSGTARTLVSRGGLDAFAARVAADGSTRWVARAGGPGDDIARGIAVGLDAAGRSELAITGAIGDGAVFDGAAGAAPPRSGPIYAARLDGDGSFVWASFAGGGVPGQGYGVAVDSGGGVVVTGYVNGPAPFGNAPGGLPVTVDPANGRAFLARWGADGRLLWARSLGGTEGEGDAVTIGAAGEIVACGQFEGVGGFGAAGELIADSPGRPAVYLTAYSTAGDAMWARRLTGIGIRPWRLRPGSDGELLVAASFGGGVVVDPDGPRPATLFSKGNDDPMFIRLDAGGALVWAFAGGGPGADEGADVAEGIDGATWGVGEYAGPAVFGNGAAAVTLTSGTDGNAFLLRLAR